MKFFKNFFRDKSVVFYIALGVAALSLITAIIYVSVLYSLSLGEFMSWGAFAALIIAPFAFVGISLLGRERMGAAAMAVMDFAALLAFAATIYVYFIENSMDTSELSKVIGGVAACAVPMLICCVGSNVFAWMNMRKKSAPAEQSQAE